ncbi:peptide chain release factor 3 [Cryptosporangium minutisporangium]|uniref:Peptide chain release factor 3 n=1 Tax=Cryptosporangium minutisporangium TaxID=113569 RepID=A0ABP6T572_9ACTN
MSDPDVVLEARRRRTFAVISHPDAGKSTLTEALALHADAITQAGAVHGKAGRRGVTSDWMEMERQRGISVTSAALRFTYRDTILNLVDTPGHADFSEDTYRVLTAVDCAIMLLDAAKGLEPQTLRLFDVCRHRGIPIVTFINKWDRPGQDALALLDAVEERLAIRPTPITWPIGLAGDLQGLIDRRREDEVVGFSRAAGGATAATARVLDPAAMSQNSAYRTAVEELDLLSSVGAEHEPEAFLAGKATPVYFGSAVSNIGVRHLLDGIIDLAPSPAPRPTVSGAPRPLDADFSGVVFKVQANMDRAHRDRIAFVRVCSGRFDRGMQVVHAATGRPFSTKYASALFGQERSTLETAYPGDVIGLVNATALRVGDTLCTGRAVAFPPLPAFAPEHFAVLRPQDLSRVKQFRRGVTQLDEEGVVQVLVSDRRGEQAPVLAAVGPMQFDVALHRLAHEFSAPGVLEPLTYQVARRTDAAGAPVLERAPGVEVFTRTRDGALLAVFPTPWRLASVSRDHPGVRLDPMLDNPR